MPERLRIGVVMDPIGGITPYKDTTLALMLEAQRRGHELLYMEQPDLHMRDGVVFAHMRALQVRDDDDDWYGFDGAAATAPPLASATAKRSGEPRD